MLDNIGSTEDYFEALISILANSENIVKTSTGELYYEVNGISYFRYLKSNKTLYYSEHNTYCPILRISPINISTFEKSFYIALNYYYPNNGITLRCII